MTKFEDKGKKDTPVGFTLTYGEEFTSFQGLSDIDTQEWVRLIKDLQAEAKKSSDHNKELQQNSK